MRGVIALHGGGEFLPGDERTLGSILQEARANAADAPLRIAVVPTAAARGRPDLAGANGVAAFRRVARAIEQPIAAEVVGVVDASTAADPDLVATLRSADVIYLPGGDPDLIPTLFAGAPAWGAIQAANEAGALVAGASAGAMALAAWTWTPGGGLPGLGLVPGITVVPHVDARSWPEIARRWGAGLPPGLGALGIGERTAVLITPGDAWRVVGQGEVRWLPSGTDPAHPRVAADGDIVTP